jgi:chloride channel protein, CIC family
MTEAEKTTGLSTAMRRLIRVRIWLGERFQINEWQATIFWAVMVGLAGAWTSIGFKNGTDWLHAVFTGHATGYVASFQMMPWWRRIAVPVAGGFLAGLTLYFGSRLKGRGNSTDYMEAVVLGDGNLSVRASLVKCASACFTAASGSSIGREGPLVLLSSVAASVAGRWMGFPLARKRQIVACGAAAGIASAYNAPVTGAIFVAEIVLGSVAMESFGPLVVSSVVATLVTREHFGAEALYSAPAFHLGGNRDLFPYLLVGLCCGLAVPLYLKFLKRMELLFGALKLPSWARLALGGLIVGVMSVWHPEVTGNGRSLIFGILHHPGTWQALAVILVFKVFATGVTFGSGAVGGVFTPTLFTGAAFGYLLGVASAALLPGWNLEPGAFGLVGMGAFLAAATGAPVMAVILLFELTLNYQILIPVMLASVMSYYVCRSLTTRSLYGDALKRKGSTAVAHQLAALKVGDLMGKAPGGLSPDESFGEMSRRFLQSRHEFLHVVSGQRYLGAVSLHDIKPYLDQPELEGLLIARDIMREDLPRLAPGQTMDEALGEFGKSDCERLPVIDAAGDLVGALSKTDVLLFLAGKPRGTPA